MQKIKSYRFGIFAEYIAIIYLKLCLYSILSRRYKTKLGEVDIIAKRGNSIIFVEVKARKKIENSYFSLTPHQQQRIIRAAKLFIAKNPKYNISNIRFDLILICPNFIIKHIKNAWTT
jgi:putative endonuclease